MGYGFLLIFMRRRNKERKKSILKKDALFYISVEIKIYIGNTVHSADTIRKFRLVCLPWLSAMEGCFYEWQRGAEGKKSCFCRRGFRTVFVYCKKTRFLI